MTAEPTDPRIADIVRAGKVRIALFPSFFYTKTPETGELQGVGIELARAFAARLGVEAELREFPSPPKAVHGLKAGECDVAFLGIDPDRAADVDFSPAYMQADFTFLVPAGSAVCGIADADRSGVRVAVVRDHAMEFALRGTLKQAETVYAATPDAAFDLLRARQADVLEGIRPGLLRYSAELAGSRVLEERYGANVFALAILKGQAGRLAYISEFIEEARRSGLVQRAIASAGLGGVQIVSA
jgi:polar amino acid transport system substrate-binding protein